MLVLTRHINETIMIGDDIEITVLEVKGDKVKIGIQAPGSVPVHRKEIYLAIKEANIAAAQSAVQLPPALEKLDIKFTPAKPKQHKPKKNDK